jgi:hypothetical protein
MRFEARHPADGVDLRSAGDQERIFEYPQAGSDVSQLPVDFYGVSSSRLQGGLPTDRLLAEWRLDSPRVQRSLKAVPHEQFAGH